MGSEEDWDAGVVVGVRSDGTISGGRFAEIDSKRDGVHSGQMTVAVWAADLVTRWKPSTADRKAEGATAFACSIVYLRGQRFNLISSQIRWIKGRCPASTRYTDIVYVSRSYPEVVFFLTPDPEQVLFVT